MPEHAEPRAMARIVERNIAALLAHRRAVEKRKAWPVRVADAITRFTGSMKFVAIHVVLFGGWILWNLPGSPLPRFDPSYVILAMAASVEAIFLSTFVLISQNRMMQLSDERADLDLQINLLAEHEVTRLIRMMKRIGERLGVEEVEAPDLPELERDVEPEQVLDTMERTERRAGREPPAERGPDGR